MNTNDYYVLRLSVQREHDQVIAALAELWRERKAKQSPKPQPVRAPRNIYVSVRSHAHA
jgi:hypothetical protein